MNYNILDFQYIFTGYEEHQFLNKIVKTIDKRFFHFRNKNNASESQSMPELVINFSIVSKYPTFHIVKSYDERYALSKVGFLTNDEIVFHFRYPEYLFILAREKKSWKAKFIIHNKILQTNSFIERLSKFKDWSYLNKVEKYAYSFMNILDLVFIIANLVNSNKFFLLHSSGISINNKAYCFTGVSNIGKTSLVLKLLTTLEDAKFLTEDMAYVNNKGITVLDPRDFRIYPDVIEFNPFLKEKLFKNKIDRLQWELRKILGRKHRNVRRLIMPEVIFGKEKLEYNKIHIDTIFVLLHEHSNLLRQFQKKEIEKWIVLNVLDDFSFYLLALDSVILRNPKINNNFPSYSELYRLLLLQVRKLLSSVNFEILCSNDKIAIFNSVLENLTKRI